jgi:hypothetical protein
VVHCEGASFILLIGENRFAWFAGNWNAFFAAIRYHQTTDESRV